jgi:hypothetical protein
MDGWKKQLVHYNTSERGTPDESDGTFGGSGLAKERPRVPMALEQAMKRTLLGRLSVARDPHADTPSSISHAALAPTEALQPSLSQEELTKSEMAILLRALESCGPRVHPSTLLRLRARIAGRSV